MSYRKLASEVVIGDRVWRAGRYWFVDGITTTDGTAIELHLRAKSGAKATWAYRSDFDVAVGNAAEMDSMTSAPLPLRRDTPGVQHPRDGRR